MIDNPVIFYSASFLILLFVLMTLLAKNIIYSLLSSVVVFFLGALFFYVLGSEYNAIIQAAIYGLAVPVIIGVSIMFRQEEAGGEKKSAKFAIPYLTLMCAGIFVLAFIYLVMMSVAMVPDTFCLKELEQVNSFDNISVFARGIFVNYVWAFELVSVLLTIVIAGLSLFRKKGA